MTGELSAQATVLAIDGAAGREVSFEAFVAAHHARAVRMAWRLTGADEATAEEITQDAFLRAQTRRADLRDEGALRAWFYRILVRRAANYRRWAAVRRRAAEWLRWEEPRRREWSDPGLDEAMQRLSPGQREVFTLVYLEQFTLDESAQILGKAPGTVRSHLHRALKTLRAELHPVMEELR